MYKVLAIIYCGAICQGLPGKYIFSWKIKENNIIIIKKEDDPNAKQDYEGKDLASMANELEELRNELAVSRSIAYENRKRLTNNH